MFPLALERQFKSFFGDMFRRQTGGFAKSLIKLLGSKESVIHRDNGDVRIDGLADILSFVSSLAGRYGESIDRAKLEELVRSQAAYIDAWSRDKTAELISKMKVLPGSFPTALLSLREKELTEAFVKRNVSLIKGLSRSHIDKISDIVRGGLLSGRSHGEIVREIKAAVEAGEAKAEFWGRDQAGKFFGEVTRERQMRAGFTGYVWRSFHDSRVRDRHAAVDGRYFEWKSPPAVGGKGERLHPGEDYNCRCWAEPAFGPEYADTPAVTAPKPAASSVQHITPGIFGKLFKTKAKAAVQGKGHAAKLRKAFNKKTSAYLGKDMRNKETGNKAAFSGKSQRELRSMTHNSQRNGFTVAEHFEMAMQIKSLYKNAELIVEHADTKNGRTDLRIERYLSQEVLLSTGKKVRACITVKHTLHPDGRLIYSLEVMDIIKALVQTRAKGQQPHK